MKRIFGWVLGAIIGVGIVYALRRWADGNSPAELPTTTTPTFGTTETKSTAPAFPTSTTPKAESISAPAKAEQPVEQPANVQAAKRQTVVHKLEPAPISTTAPQIKSSNAEIEASQETAEASANGSSDNNPFIEVAPAAIATLLNEADAAKLEQDVRDNDVAIEPQAATENEGDNLVIIKGVGQATAQKLEAAGITTFAQLGALSPEELEEKTGISASRVQRDKIIEQAQYLARGEEFTFTDVESEDEGK